MGLLWTSVKNERSYNKSPERIIVEEKRAPTDLSIQLAQEYEEIIEKKIKEKLLVQGNLVNFSLAFQKDFLTHKFHIKMKINEIDFSETFIIKDPNLETLLNDIKNWLSEKILMEPIREIITSYLSNQTDSYKFIGLKD